MKNYATEDTYRIFSRNLRRILFDLNIKEQQLATITGLSVSSISRYVNGHVIPTDENIEKIIHALDCTVDDLFDPTNYEDESWVDIRDHPNYEINRSRRIRNKRTGRVLRNQNDDRGRGLIQLDKRTRRIKTLYKDSFDIE